MRLLKPNEIECRVGSITTKGFTILLYKNARCDMAILDEVYGAMNWQRKHSRDNANCTIEVWDDEKKQWVGKEDTGTESNTEQEKGLASDSFKRAGFNWGIGRELYTAPFIYITPKSTTEIKTNEKTNKPMTYTKIFVKEIAYNDNNEINKLVLEDDKGVIRYTMGLTNADEKELNDASIVTKGQLQIIEQLIEDNNADLDTILQFYGVDALKDLTTKQAEQCRKQLEKKVK